MEAFRNWANSSSTALVSSIAFSAASTSAQSTLQMKLGKEPNKLCHIFRIHFPNYLGGEDMLLL